MSVRQTIARNTFFNAAGRLWEAVSGLLLMIYILECHLGWAEWGLWSLVAVFTGYVALLDFGIGSGFAKYIAEHAARGEKERLSSLVSTGFFFYLLLSPILIGVGWPCIDLLIGGFIRLMVVLAPDRAEWLNDVTAVADIRFLFRWGLVLFAASNCISAFTAVQSGLQRMGITNVLSFGASLIKIATTVLFLELGHGVRGLLYSNAVVTAAFGIASITIAFHLAPGLRVSPRLISKASFRQLFSFGWRAQVAKLANIIMFQTDKVIIGVWMTQLAPVGLYRLGEDLANKGKQIPQMLLSALIPAVSDLDAREEHETLRRLYLLSSKYVAAVAVPVLAFSTAAAGMIVHTVMGDKAGLDMAATVLRFLAMSNLANVICGAGITLVLGRGRVDLHMKSGLVAAGTNVALTLLLVYWLGFAGVPMATMLSMFLGWAWFLWAIRGLVRVPFRVFAGAALTWPVLAALPGSALCVACSLFVAASPGRLPNAAAVVVCGGLFVLSYLLIIRMTPFLDAFDVRFLEENLKLARVPGFNFWARTARGRTLTYE